MYTLVEIFDAKQYENILSPIILDNISKVIYVGTREVMTPQKIKNLKSFYRRRKSNLPLEFLYVERDNANSVKSRLTQLVKNNQDCIFDVTGGEDVILAVVGIISQQFNIPIIRVDARDASIVQLHADATSLRALKPKISLADAITLQGGKILRSDTIYDFTKDDIYALSQMFSVNALDCEAYSAFCNAVAECISQNGKKIIINKNDFAIKLKRTAKDINAVFNELCKRNLIEKESDTAQRIVYRICYGLVSKLILKAGNALEYYTAYAASSLSEPVYDIKTGVSIEWNDNNTFSDTQNEIDVMAISNLHPLFISCKNGEVKKDALYELDAVSRALGGAYSKKVLVCTYISKNASAREHFIKRAHDMNISLVYDVHTLSFEKFTYYLNKALK